MKKKSLFVFVLMVVAITLWGNHLTWGRESQGYGPGKTGKVLIQVIDAGTFLPVNEIFEVCFINPAIETEPGLRHYESCGSTDNNGRAVIEVKPGLYYLQFEPEDLDSIYEMDPSPILFSESRQKITVKDGQYTPVVKKVHRGGTLKIVLTDASGNKINPGQMFSRPGEIKADIDAFGKIGVFDKGSISHTWLTKPTETFEDGEVLIKRLPQGAYSVTVRFGRLGIMDISVKEKIQISRGSTSVCKIPVNLNPGNITGIEGYIKDLNGNPLKKIEVCSSDIKCLTDDNGFYRLLGINANRKSILVIDDSNLASTGKMLFESVEVKLTEGKVVRKDITIDHKK